ncbi:hypothetical protein Pint_20237 [Pistacia integerrima]|uniref:Uncharacterized protein n=1 Tax=Pistacia integerrima TaxID=434235 RepID=A0ACC0XBF9_9ROSI|nr:hypothetical protein Pint_20237 [Pistacia integerrima]
MARLNRGVQVGKRAEGAIDHSNYCYDGEENGVAANANSHKRQGGWLGRPYFHTMTPLLSNIKTLALFCSASNLSSIETNPLFPFTISIPLMFTCLPSSAPPQEVEVVCTGF